MQMHSTLFKDKWQMLTLAEQMGNIGSEVGRAFSWKEKGQKEKMMAAIDRALELFDLTLSDSRWTGRRKEIARARENVCEEFFGVSSLKNAKSLENYFMQFALYARSGR